MLHGIDPVFAVSGLVVGLLVGFHRRRRRVAHDAASRAGLRGPSGDRGRHRPSLCRSHQDQRRAPCTPITARSIGGSHGGSPMEACPRRSCRFCCSRISGRLPRRAAGIISTTLGIALILTAVTLVFRKALLARLTRLMDGASEQTVGVLTVVLGVVLGVLVSISSVGAGAIGATILLTLYPKSPIVRIVGSDIAHAVPLTLIAGAGHWWLGSVDFHMLVSLLVGLDPGHYDLEPFRLPRSRPRPAPHPRRHACGRRRTPRVLNERRSSSAFGLFPGVPPHCPPRSHEPVRRRRWRMRAARRRSKVSWKHRSTRATSSERRRSIVICSD